MVFLALVAAGCNAAAAKKDGLSVTQRAAWEDKRKEVADYPYVVVGYDVDEKDWMTCAYTDPKLYKYEWKKLTVDLWFKDQMDSAFELARQRAESDNSIACTAVVDLVGEPEPKALKWFFRDGERLRRSSGAPRPDLGVSLKKYLSFVQTHPDMVAVPKN
jgi:hypothetical protein